MGKWEIFDFDEVIIDDTKNGTKIKKEDYLEIGRYPIVDQGQNIFAGYSNIEEGIFTDVPAIIFGDHTRVIKYVDTPFFLGADGVKLLKCKKRDVNYKYLYYFFFKNEVVNTGYNRHFKWLKELKIPLPPLEVQRKIAETLDAASELLAMRKNQLAELDKLIQSVFYDMFGDPVTNEKGWEIKNLKAITKKIGSGATPRGGKESYQNEGISLIRSMNVHNGEFKYADLAFLSEEQAKLLNNVVVEKDDVLINITGASVARSCIVPEDVLPARVNQHVAIIRLKENKANSTYINKLLTDNILQQKLLSIAGAGGATREAITKQQLEGLLIPLPPLQLQTHFAETVKKIEEQKALVQKAIDETQALFDSLMNEYFG